MPSYYAKRSLKRGPDDKLIAVEICHLYLSPGHNFFGHAGQAAGDYPAVEVGKIECVAGRGIRGDRFFDFKDDYKGQITFFSIEVFEKLCAAVEAHDRPPSSVRRNVLTRGIDLNDLIGTEFEIQGVRFEGVEECRPCLWMEEAVGAGAHAFLKGRGGLRARILNDGEVRSTASVLAAG